MIKLSFHLIRLVEIKSFKASLLSIRLRWSLNLQRRFPRRTHAACLTQAMGTLNPLVLLKGFDCSHLKFCTMHVANLGFVQTHNASCLIVLLAYSF